MISFNINTYVTVCDPVCPMKSKGRTNSLPTLRGMAKWATTTSVMLQFYSCHKYRARGGMSVIYVWKRRVEFVAQQRARILKTFLPEKSQLSPIGRTNLSERGNFAFSRRLWPFFSCTALLRAHTQTSASLSHTCVFPATPLSCCPSFSWSELCIVLKDFSKSVTQFMSSHYVCCFCLTLGVRNGS